MKLLAGSQTSRELLIACLLEAIGQQDPLLLREIEKNLREKCSELCNGPGTRGSK
jgi:hypothetical protein